MFKKKIMNISFSETEIKIMPSNKVIPLSENITDGVNIHDIQTVSALLKKENLKAKHVTMALPNKATISKEVPLAYLDDEDIEAEIIVNRDRYFPEIKDEIALDFIRLPEEQKVLAVACPKIFINQRLEIARQANLKLIAINIESQEIILG